MSQYSRLDVIGRDEEILRIRACLKAKRNVLLEGPVGVGKTHLALAVTHELNLPVFRVDGDSRYSEQKLSGWFDPPTVMKKGFGLDSFIPGPLVEAMRQGGVLFINELNRLPEGVQNILLPAMDERLLLIPRLGEIRAQDSFRVIATQNPKEFVATTHLSEAILDRFELVALDYPSEEEENRIVSQRIHSKSGAKTVTSDEMRLSQAAVSVVRMTRVHPKVRRGASIRAAISVAEIAQVFLRDGMPFEEALIAAILMALPTRIEIERGADSEQSLRVELENLLKEFAESALKELGGSDLKKKS